MDKEIILKRIEATDDTLGKMKEFFNEHAGETITNEETIEKVQRLEELAKQLLIDLSVMKQYMLKEYGIFVFTENGI